MEEKHIFISSKYDVGERITSDKSVVIYLDSNGLIPDNWLQTVLFSITGFLIVESVFIAFSRRSNFIAFISIFVCLLVIFSSVYGTYVLHSIYKSIATVETPNTFYAHIGVFVKKDSVYAPHELVSDDGNESKLIPGESLEGCSLGTIISNLDKGYTSQGIRNLRKEFDVNIIVYDTFKQLIDAFTNGEIDAIVYNEAFLGTYLGEDTDFFSWAIESISIGIETEHTIKTIKADIVSEPFFVYISGIDTSKVDYFPDAARCDGNIIAAVDPVNKKISCRCIWC